MTTVTKRAPNARQPWRPIIDHDERVRLGRKFYALIMGWYGGLDNAAVALGIDRGALGRYSRGERPIPDALLYRLLDSRGRVLSARLNEVRGRVERARIKAAERERIILEADEAGVAAFRERLKPKDPTFVWTRLGYKPVDQVKPHPRKIRQKARED